MIQASLVVFTGNLAQAAGALGLALILARFHRLYQRPYLRTWAWSWWAYFASLVGVSASLYLMYLDPAPVTAPLRLAASGVALTGAYWQAALLLFGTFEVVAERRLPRRLRYGILAASAVVAAGSVLASLALSPHARYFARIGVRALLLGLAFVIASLALWRSRPRLSGLGRRMVAAAFLFFGLHQFHYLVIVVSQMARPGSLRYAPYLGPFDFLFQALMGIGMVIWLLEEERQRIEHLAHHDTLTGLPNRSLLLRHIERALARRPGRLAVLFIDLDRFNFINDSLGRGDADELIKSLADRLRRNLRGTDLVARLAADEFAVLLPLESEGEVVQVAEKLLGLIRRPFSVDGRELYVTASAGISRYPEDGEDPEELLKKAEIAMVRAKEQTRDGYQLYTPDMDSKALERLSLESDLRKALANGELTLFYQPVLDANTGEVRAVEALLRWQHPLKGLLGPGAFLWLADVSGLSNALDLWVLRTACGEIEGWLRDGAPPLSLAVNLSARSFERPDLVERLREVLAETGLPASALELEVTETLAMRNAEGTLAVLRGLKELGVRIAIDDFGTGYSSLSYLTNFPIDTLKVDRSFVQALNGVRGSEEVAAAVIALAQSLEIGVVAEGVEEEVQWEILRNLGCDRVQGYLFSRPLPAVECREYVLSGASSRWDVSASGAG